MEENNYFNIVLVKEKSPHAPEALERCSLPGQNTRTHFSFARSHSFLVFVFDGQGATIQRNRRKKRLA